MVHALGSHGGGGGVYDNYVSRGEVKEDSTRGEGGGGGWWWGGGTNAHLPTPDPSVQNAALIRQKKVVLGQKGNV